MWRYCGDGERAVKRKSKSAQQLKRREAGIFEGNSAGISCCYSRNFGWVSGTIDPETVARRYRIHFRHGLRRAADYDKLMARMAAQFRAQGPGGILKAWAVESRLYLETWDKADYDLLPKLRSLQTPTLVIVGEHDFIPPEIATAIAKAMPRATLAIIPDCGHFAYLECGTDVRKTLDNFFSRSAGCADG